MKVEEFVKATGAEFYAGVPDSQLKALCDYLIAEYGVDGKHHVIAANEGNAVAVAAGYHLATGRVPAVYMQNSGIGNAINPLASLLNEKVYAIPCIFVIGWRGEPGVPDEPQHIYQGEVTCKLLQDMGVEYRILSKDMELPELEEIMRDFRAMLTRGKSVAFVVRKGALEYEGGPEYKNQFSIKREEAIKSIASHAGGDVIVSTTGKASRELFEMREANGDSHEKDFLTVGSMGHASSIALGIAVSRPEKRVWCIDGDGAALMHMGAMAVIGNRRPPNLVHVVINNGSHESVGGQPTVLAQRDLHCIAREMGYERAACVQDMDSLEQELQAMEACQGLAFLEIKCAIGAREDLGRPTETPRENKKSFMDYLGANRESKENNPE